MSNNSLERSILEFKIAVIKILYKNKKISNNEYSNALSMYEKKLYLYSIQNSDDEKNFVIDIKI